MNSLYECDVMHCRLQPKRHAFNYRVFMFSVDVDDLPTLNKKFFGFSHNRFNFFSINDSDHIDIGADGGIRGNLVSWLNSQGIACPANAIIQLITFPRVFGYGFNPISFYYVYSNSGLPITAVAEVVNTFREMKLYAIQNFGADGVWHRRISKNFYVSPFSDPGIEFDFKLGKPESKWQVNIDDYELDERILLSSVRGERRQLSSSRLMWYTLKYPLLSLKIIGMIHWHAAILWIRKVPFFRKDERREAQLNVMRPHTDLNKNLP